MTTNILIEGCNFSTSSTLTNVTIQNTFALVTTCNYAKININNCNTIESNFYGNFLSCVSANYCDLIINNCNIYNATGVSGTGLITAQLIKSFSLTNCYFNWASSTSVIDFTKIEIYGISNSNIFINNNTFISNDLATSGGHAPTAIYCNTSYQIDISNNIFSNIGNGIYISLPNTAIPKSINIEKNILSGTLTPYSLCAISQQSNYLIQNIGFVNISNNIIKTGSAPLILESVRNKQAISVIGIYANIDCKINNNNIVMITGFTGSVSTDLESCIQFIGNGSCILNSNTIAFTDTKSTRSFAAIYVSYSWLSDTYTISSESVIITNNILRGGILTTVNSSYIYVRNFIEIIINDNILNKVVTAPEWYIRAHNASVFESIPVITGNILGSELANGGILYKNYSVSNLLINAYVARNKNQKYMKDINCTSFMQYGFNTDVSNPYSKANVMFKSTSFIIANTSVDNLNRYQQRIVDYMSSWDTLPSALYYTNAGGYEASLDTSGHVTAPISSTFFKHQTIIPLDIPNFTKITNIKIPLYLKNTSVSDNKTYAFSLSLIAGNYTGNIEYISDPAAEWTYTTETLGTSTEVDRTLDVDFTDLYFNPTRNTTDSTLLPQQNCYLLFSITSATLDTDNSFIFAIPYVRLTLVY